MDLWFLMFAKTCVYINRSSRQDITQHNSNFYFQCHKPDALQSHVYKVQTSFPEDPLLSPGKGWSLLRPAGDHVCHALCGTRAPRGHEGQHQAVRRHGERGPRGLQHRQQQALRGEKRTPGNTGEQ